MNTFQTIILGIFGFFIIVGLIVISTAKSRGGEEQITVTMWGSAPAEKMRSLTEGLFPKNFTLAYREISPESLDREIVEALAAGHGPDTVLLPVELLLRHRDKLYPIPYANFSERDYRDAFIQAGDAFLFPQGIFALPFSVDPLVMYWNRNLLDDASITAPPKYWDEFLLLASRITSRDRIGNFTRSAVSLGEYRNVSHAKEVLTTLLLQSGNPVVSFSEGGFPTVSLSEGKSRSVVDFYTEFANPAKTVYSWNRSLPDSRSAFLKGMLGVYFGFGSELQSLRKDNPNLNFDVTFFPKPRDASVSLTYGKLTGIALLRTSSNLSASLQVALTLSSSNAGARFSADTGLPPVQRALLANKPTDAFGGILYDSAIRSRGFLDPYPAESERVFQTMIESITSGRAEVGSVLSRAESELKGLVR